MPFKDVEERRKYQREWYLKHRKQKIASVLRYKRKKMKDAAFRAKENNWKFAGEKRRMQFLRDYFGSKCIFCEEDTKQTGRTLCLHEIHGKRHPWKRSYHIQHLEDFAPLCDACHRTVHHLMKVFGLSWKDILDLKKTYQQKK